MMRCDRVFEIDKRSKSHLTVTGSVQALMQCGTEGLAECWDAASIVEICGACLDTQRVYNYMYHEYALGV